MACVFDQVIPSELVRQKSSRYTTFLKASLLKKFGSSITQVNTLGAEERPKGSTWNSYSFPLHWKRKYLPSSGCIGIVKNTSLRSSLDRNFLSWTEFMSIPKPSIWKCSYFTRWLSLFIMTGLEPPPFFSTRNNIIMYSPWTGWAVVIAPFISVTSRSINDFLGTKSLDPQLYLVQQQCLRNYVGTSAVTDVALWSPMSCPVTSDFLADVILEHNLGCHNDNDQ